MKAKGKAVQSEDDMQDQLCAYLKIAYPRLIFRIDLAGIHKSLGAGARMKRQQWGRKWPDLFLCEPRGGYHGFFIEAKKEDVLIFNKAGGYSSDHIAGQAEVLQILQEKGYKALFGVGFYGCKALIDGYMQLPLPHKPGSYEP